MFFGIFFLSLSALMFELALIRLVSVIMLSHLAFLGITTALYGIALGGIIVYLFPNYFPSSRLTKRTIQFSLLYSISLVLFILFFLRIDFSSGNFRSIFLAFFLAAIPFIFVNVSLSLLFKIKGQIMGKLYFFDLLGAGLGAIAAIVLMTNFSAINTVFLAAAMGFIAAAFFGFRQKKVIVCSSILVFILVSFAFINQQSNLIKIIYSKDGKETNIIFSKWNSFSRVSVEDEKEPRMVASLPGDSTTFLPKQLGIEIDSSAYTPILEFNGDFETVEFLRDDLSSLGFRIIEPAGDVLIIGPGGGRDVLAARLFNHKIKGVDINPIIVSDLMKDRFAEFSGNLYSLPDVDIVVAEGRSFIHTDPHTYNAISIPLTDTWASTSAGNLVLVESNLYTVEAFQDYLAHLKPNGILSISRWEQDGMRLVSLFLEASKNLGIENPKENIVIIKNKTEGDAALNNYLFKPSPFSAKMLAAIESYSQETGFPIVYSARYLGENDYYSYLLASDKNSFINAYPKNLKPVYDNNPFYFFNMRLGVLLNPIGFGFNEWDGGLLASLTIATLLTIIFIFFPLLFTIKTLRPRVKKSFMYLGYFAGLGLAFMLLEISLIQKFILYLERPIFSYSLVLVALLVFAGIGSFISKDLNPSKNSNYFKIGLAILCLIIIYVIILKTVFTLTIGMNIYYKLVITTLIHMPLALLMGMMLPLGIRRLHAEHLERLIPWCWAVNGGMSVLASVLAILFAIYIGFNNVLLLGGLIYLGSGIFLLGQKLDLKKLL